MICFWSDTSIERPEATIGALRGIGAAGLRRENGRANADTPGRRDQADMPLRYSVHGRAPRIGA